MAGDPMQRPKFISLRQVGLGGLVSLGDPQDIKDTESPDLRNIAFSSGVPGPRFGTTLVVASPEGETGAPTQLIKGKDSRGNSYIIAVYGTNFYLLDLSKPQWIKITGAYSVTLSNAHYGYDSWNKGTGADALYLCNGTDDVGKWVPCLTTVKTTTAASDTTLTLADTSAMLATGTVVVVKNDGTVLTAAYTANNTSTGVLTLSGQIGAVINSGNAATVSIIAVSAIPIGKIIKAGAPSGGARLFTANKAGSESILNFSKDGSPEDFGQTVSALSGGSQTIIDGEGGILDVVDFGTYLAVVKQNAITQFYFTIDNTANTIYGYTTPLERGESITPIGQFVSLLVENVYYYPTTAQGIFAFIPGYTGLATSTKNIPFADKVFQLLQGLFDFSKGGSEYFQRGIYWTCSTIPNVNNVLLIKDLIWDAWTIWDNLNAADVKESGGVLYFLCEDDGGLYKLDSNSNQDFRSSQPVGYSTYMFTKRFDWSEPALPKTHTLAMVQGYISPNTKLYVDVLYNEGGSLATSTYIIDGSNNTYVTQVPVYGIGRVSLGQNPIGGSQTGTIGSFRVYLDLLRPVGAHNIQFKFYTQNIGDNWGLTGLSVNPELVEKTPPEIIIGVQ